MYKNLYLCLKDTCYSMLLELIEVGCKEAELFMKDYNNFDLSCVWSFINFYNDVVRLHSEVVSYA